MQGIPGEKGSQTVGRGFQSIQCHNTLNTLADPRLPLLPNCRDFFGDPFCYLFWKQLLDVESLTVPKSPLFVLRDGMNGPHCCRNMRAPHQQSASGYDARSPQRLGQHLIPKPIASRSATDSHPGLTGRAVPNFRGRSGRPDGKSRHYLPPLRPLRGSLIGICRNSLNRFGSHQPLSTPCSIVSNARSRERAPLL
jgi:hypothetical protein